MKSCRFCLALFPLFLCSPLLLAQDAAPRDAQKMPADSQIDAAVDAVYPALVRVNMVIAQGQQGRMHKGMGSGSGAIISEEGYVLTNHHVAGDATRITCRLSNREEVDAVLVGTDALTDLAVLKLDLSKRKDKTPLRVAKFGDSSKVKVGQTVLAMGSPAGLSQSVTQGIIANTEMMSPPSSGPMILDGENVGELVRWIGHDAVIYPGNSGGPLVNLQGEIIGVNEVGIGSLGGAIPSSIARTVSEELIKKGYVSRSWTGLAMQPLLRNGSEEKGILVASVMEDSPAKTAGFEPGDVLTHFDGQEVSARFAEEMPVFNRLVLTTPIGKEVELKGLRKGAAMTWKLTTAEREPAEHREMELKNWGITGRDLTRAAMVALRRPDKNGVLVASLTPGGPSASAKPALQGGDLIVSLDGTPVANIHNLREFTAKKLEGKSEAQPVLVGFSRNNGQYLTQIKIGPETRDDKPQTSRKAWIGIATQVLTKDLATALNLPGKKGVRVTEVFSGTMAKQAGLQVGDIILKVDGTVILARNPEDEDVFSNMIRDFPLGADAVLTVVREGKESEVPVKLEGNPPPTSELAEWEDQDFEFTARDLSFDDKKDSRNLNMEGVTLTKIQAGGWAALAGLSVGDNLLSIDAAPIKSVKDLERVLKAIKEKKSPTVLFFAKRGSQTFFRELEPVWD